MLVLSNYQARQIASAVAEEEGGASILAPMYIHSELLCDLHERLCRQFPDYVVAYDEIVKTVRGRGWFAPYMRAGPLRVASWRRAHAEAHLISVRFQLNAPGDIEVASGLVSCWILNALAWLVGTGRLYRLLQFFLLPLVCIAKRKERVMACQGISHNEMWLIREAPGITYAVRLVHRLSAVSVSNRAVVGLRRRSPGCYLDFLDCHAGAAASRVSWSDGLTLSRT